MHEGPEQPSNNPVASTEAFMAPKWWLLLEKSDETRISSGIDPYMDETGSEYRYDSLVPNHKNLSARDGAVIRKENDIIGTCFIDAITRTDGFKTHRRCPQPQCSSTDVRERRTLTPRWKCGVCKAEFSTPKETQTPVTSYVATLRDFRTLKNPPSVKEVKACAAGGDGAKSQHSMIELDPSLLATTLGQALPLPSATPSKPPSRARGGQGYGLTHEQRTAVELRAMTLAATLYPETDGWLLKNTSKDESYDFCATRGHERRFIEVKGTTGTGESVILTYREVEHARAHREEMALVVVTNITLRSDDGAWHAEGGRISVHQHPWSPEKEQLTATEYRYEVLMKDALTASG